MLTTSRLAGDRYVNNILAALSEIPSIIVQQISINRIGRRYVLVMFHSFSGITLILATMCSSYSGKYYWLKHFSTFFSIFGRFSAAGSFSSVFLYTPELYPTNLRNVGLGMASTVSRIGSMISPFAATLADHVFWGPAAIFALLNIICTIILLTLPETMGRELPTTVEEMKSWVKDKKGNF
ncbi:OCTN [Mytilus edulis]|uniref:SLC22A4_5 n=1 Tax=Mytilus edulis TaxID=6550 RepID=A0A8S3PXW8_MYTED|nr:OCTN [Mytilus edulis]